MEINEITPEHVGREVMLLNWPAFQEIIALNEKGAWITSYMDSIDATCFDPKDHWILKDLPTSKKTPSERIVEIGSAPIWSATVIPHQWSFESKAIIKYLDEEAEKEEGK